MNIYCNCCGKEIRFHENGKTALEDYIAIDKNWGYFSGKDGIRQKMIVCESCFDAWVEKFAIAPQEEEELELL